MVSVDDSVAASSYNSRNGVLDGNNNNNINQSVDRDRAESLQGSYTPGVGINISGSTTAPAAEYDYEDVDCYTNHDMVEKVCMFIVYMDELLHCQWTLAHIFSNVPFIVGFCRM